MRLEAQIHDGSSYGLMELNPELLEAYNQGSLYLKSNDDQQALVACTKSQTFEVRQLNQTNTLLLCQENGESLRGFGACFSLLESSSTIGTLPTKDIAVYKRGGHNSGPTESMQQVFSRSPCSEIEFRNLRRRKGIFELDSRACILDDQAVYMLIREIVTTLIDEGLGLEGSASSIHGSMRSKEPIEVVQAVHDMFFDTDVSELSAQRIGAWIGAHLLQNQTIESPLSQFMTEWQHSVPLVHVELDLSMLKGHYLIRNDNIRALQASRLSPDTRSRFQQLFELKSEWDLDEIEPFIADLKDPKAKLENWVLKYARRTRRAEKYVVMSRR